MSSGGGACQYAEGATLMWLARRKPPALDHNVRTHTHPATPHYHHHLAVFAQLRATGAPALCGRYDSAMRYHGAATKPALRQHYVTSLPELNRIMQPHRPVLPRQHTMVATDRIGVGLVAIAAACQH